MPAPSSLVAATFAVRLDLNASNPDIVVRPAKRALRSTPPVNTPLTACTVAVRIGGSSEVVVALIDSGTQRSSISAALCARHALPLGPVSHSLASQHRTNATPTSPSAHSKVKQQYTVTELHIGPHLLPVGPFFVSSELNSTTPHEIVLGFDFLRTYSPFIQWNARWIYFNPDHVEMVRGAIAKIVLARGGGNGGEVGSVVAAQR